MRGKKRYIEEWKGETFKIFGALGGKYLYKHHLPQLVGKLQRSFGH